MLLPSRCNSLFNQSPRILLSVTLALISHPDCLHHEMGVHHPESPQRITVIDEQLLLSGSGVVLERYRAPAVERCSLLLAHGADYVDSVFAQSPPTGQRTFLDSDTSMNPYTLDAALRAAGAAVYAVDLVMRGAHRVAFCNVRPPGHHAEHSRAMGFCFFNNVAVGVCRALEVWGLERVAIVDFDVHHGNGTGDIFRDEPRVLFCSTFQHPFYPFSDVETGSRHLLHLPFAAGSGSAQYRCNVSDELLPALERFSPQLLFISAGFDAHRDDPLGGLCLTETDFAWITAQIKVVADAHAGGRIISVLEGGYDLGALGRSVVAHLQTLSNVTTG